MMLFFKGPTLRYLTVGWYWAQKYPGYWEIVPVSRNPERNQIKVDFGYCQEVYIYPDEPEKSDGYEDLTLFGPIEVPREVRNRTF